MSHLRHSARLWIAISIVFLCPCYVFALPKPATIRQLPDRLISMAYIIRHSSNGFLDKPGDPTIRDLFEPIYAMFPHSQRDDFHLISQLGFISHYCHIELTAGYFCGIEHLGDTVNNGFLFVTDWIHQDHKKYNIVIFGNTSPEQTIIVRILNNHAHVLYNSFRARNSCHFYPRSYGATPFAPLYITHFMKVLSPTKYELIVGNLIPMNVVRTATFRLEVNASSCVLTLLQQKDYTWPQADGPSCEIR